MIDETAHGGAGSDGAPPGEAANRPRGAPLPAPIARRPPGRRVRRLLIGLALTAVASLIVAWLAMRNYRNSVTPPAVGSCLAPGEVRNGEMTFDKVDCTDGSATVRVIRTVADDPFLTQPDCPDPTDLVITQWLYGSACARNLRPPHPGDPGLGGGILRAGDCVNDPSQLEREVPCSSSDSYATVLGRADQEAQCPVATLEVRTVSANARTVVCLGAGPGVLGPGDCIMDAKALASDPPKVPCSDSRARAAILARVADRSQCPPNAESVLELEGTYRPVLCVRRLPPPPGG